MRLDPLELAILAHDALRLLPSVLETWAGVVALVDHGSEIALLHRRLSEVDFPLLPLIIIVGRTSSGIVAEMPLVGSLCWLLQTLLSCSLSMLILDGAIGFLK